ncbi:MAG: hypothetical protein IJZ44_02715 [Lachnospiraceae bacterium]|nr:hypothetical protein [Lachnospiraceae bacterium]
MKKVLTVLMSMVILFSSVSTQVVAAETTGEYVTILDSTVFTCERTGQNARSTTFSDTSIDVGLTSSGLDITIYSTTNQLCSVVGVKDIEVQMKSGSKWVTVATASSGEATNTYGMGVHFTYPDAIYGNTYRIYCVHYANGDEYRELEHTSVEFKFVY